jgi:hypothetical protein
MTEREKPIVDIRGIKYSWVEYAHNAPPGAIQEVVQEAFRIEIRREGETEWTEIPVIERRGARPDET